MLPRFVVAIAIAISTLACNGHDSPSAPSPPAAVSAFNLSGTVLETTQFGTRPVDGVSLFVRVSNLKSFGHFGSTMSDAQGKYSVSNVPQGTVYLEASWNGYLQPCFASMDLRSDAVLDIEVISEATLLSLGLSSLRIMNAPTVSGLVSEAASGRPVAGAKLQVWVGDWLYGASTSTDASGRYLVCRVPREWPLNVYTGKDGYHQHIAEVMPGGDTTLDIRLERR